MRRVRGLGYVAVYLDTIRVQHEAIGLYRSLGLEEVEPHHDVPEGLRDRLVYPRLVL